MWSWLRFYVATLAQRIGRLFVRRRAQPALSHRVLFSDLSIDNGVWCTYDSLEAAQEAVQALNEAYDGSKHFLLDPDTRPPLIDDIQATWKLDRRNPYNRPWSEGYEPREWPFNS